jgi:hypothetical protein
MPLSLSGYVLEPVRVGQANSSFTLTPNIFIRDQSTFDSAYPSDESVPRTDYIVFVLEDGSFPDAVFAWSKNEGIVNVGGDQVPFLRVDYLGQDQRFKTLPGGALEVLGVLASDSNVNRLKVTTPPVIENLTNFPARVSVGSGSGLSFNLTILASASAFNPALSAGEVELAQDTSELNWSTADLGSYEGQEARFQQQSFFSFDKSTGALGAIEEALLLNPLPATGQYPLLRIGYSTYLTPIEVATDAGLSPAPSSGSVKWSLETGRLAFNTTDITNNPNRTIYYDGVAFGIDLTVLTTNIGTVSSPTTVTVREEDDLFFRVVGVVQFPYTIYVDAFNATGKKGEVQVRRSDGQVQFSLADQASYGAQTVQAVRANLNVERGMTLRMFRTPVDLAATDPTLKDVSAYWETENSTLADPIIGAPQVFLPAIPVDSLPIEVKVRKGTGDITLPRLDVSSPTAGLGYVLDFDHRQLLYAERREDVVQTPLADYGAVQLEDPLVFSSNLVLELETAVGSGTYTSLTIGEDVLFDNESGLSSLVETFGTLITEGTGGSLSGITFSDASADFVADNVAAGDLIIIPALGVFTVRSVTDSNNLVVNETSSTPPTVYEIRREPEILADRFFQKVPPLDPNTSVERGINLGTTSNSPRLSIDLTYIDVVRFRFGTAVFSTSVTQVANDASFSAPASLAAGEVEISQDTGNCNFSASDVSAGLDVYWFRTLTLGTDYTVQAPLGFIEFTERFLEEEEAFLTYKNSNGDVVEERGRFLVRKELVNHPSPASVLSFNPLGREVADDPAPRVFRGGRPQSSSQVAISTSSSTITFLPSSQVTDALPAGPPVAVAENVYVDYYVYGAIGGEQNLTVLQPPMQGVTIQITEGESSFTVPGDRTSSFATERLLLVDSTEVYLLTAPSYDSGTGLTTVNIESPQTFRSDFLNPSLSVSSGPTRLFVYLSYPAYFIVEMAAFDTIPRGSDKFYLTGDLTRTYVSGIVVLFTDGSSMDFNLVQGSEYDASTGKTAVRLASNTTTQYTSGHTLKRTRRPIFGSPSIDTNTSRTPASVELVYRQVEGSIGEILSDPEDYTIDDSGHLVLVDSLVASEEVGVLYTGYRTVEAGRSFRASYTHAVVPTLSNGLLDQTLLISYTTYSPDSFYWRVETMTNFRVEVAQSFEDDAKASVPSGGPVLENTGAPRLYEQGRESVFFQEGHLANEDLVARPTLKYFNDAINFLEYILAGMDGRVVGDRDGKFLFDGNIDNPPRTTFASATNQIDDLIKVSPAPYTVTGPPFVATSVGTYKQAYETAPTSRFYPTKRLRYGVTVPPSGLATGDPIMDTGSTNLSLVSDVQRRSPWAIVTEAVVSGSLTLQVDAAEGQEDLLRPGLNTEPGIKVSIISQGGLVLVSDAAALEVDSTTATSVTFTTGVPVNIPVGATLRLATTDDAYRKFYRVGTDVGVDLEGGLLTHIEPYPPLDGSVPLVPTELCIQNPAGGEVLDLTAALNNILTAPYRFPALDGGTTDDDGDRQFPVLTPRVDSEDGPDIGGLDQELSIIETGGTLRTLTTEPFVGTGDLDVSKLIITNTGGAWPAPAPKVRDLVQIKSGLNVGSDFRRIVAVGANTITVNTSFAQQDTGFDFSVTVSNSLVTGTAGVLTTNTLTDVTKDFVAAGVQPGHTVVIASGVNDYRRRQVTSVNTTELGIDSLTVDAGPVTYRVDDALGTFGGTNSIGVSLQNALGNESGSQTAQESNCIAFLGLVLSDLLTSSSGQVAVGDSTLVDLTVNFQTAGVTSEDYVYVDSGSNYGIFRIQSVTSPTELEIDGTFPATESGMSYKIVSASLVSRDTLEAVVAARKAAQDAFSASSAFYTLAFTLIAVSGDTGARAVQWVTSDLDSRETVALARKTALEDASGGYIASLSGIMTSGDRLYDQRYSWIDARINLETGILVKKERALENRLKAQEEILNQLLKLLAT